MHATSFLQMTVAEIGRGAGEGEAEFGFARSVMRSRVDRRGWSRGPAMW
jgi:hypothetical protein